MLWGPTADPPKRGLWAAVGSRPTSSEHRARKGPRCNACQRPQRLPGNGWMCIPCARLPLVGALLNSISATYCGRRPLCLRNLTSHVATEDSITVLTKGPKVPYIKSYSNNARMVCCAYNASSHATGTCTADQWRLPPPPPATSNGRTTQPLYVNPPLLATVGDRSPAPPRPHW